MMKPGDIIDAGDLYIMIDESDYLHDESFKFKILGGRKIYGYIMAAWRERSDKTVGVAEKFGVKIKERWIAPETKLEILSVENA